MMKAARLALTLWAIFFLAACAHREPEIRTVEVRVPVDDPACARAAVERLGEPPAYPDSPAAIRGAADLFQRVQLLLAARELRIAREAALASALKACSGG